MEPFEVYRLYLALKLHFTKKDYDITKTKGAVRASQKTFMKRKDLTSLRKIARDYTRKEAIDFLVANFVSGDRWGGLFDLEAKERYTLWLKNKHSFAYKFEQDIAKIDYEMEKEELQSPFEAKEGRHPLVFRLYFGKMISLETLVVLDKFYNYVTIENDDIFLQDTSMLIKKYRPFVQISDRIRITGERHYK
jgi:hypothetical protein